MAVIVATGIAADGSRAILGLDDSDYETFWRGLLTALKQRGRGGLRLVISDQHAGLVKALRRTVGLVDLADERATSGSWWQLAVALRCSLDGDLRALQQHGVRPEQGGDVGVEFAVHDEQVGVLTRYESAFAGADAACDCGS